MREAGEGVVAHSAVVNEALDDRADRPPPDAQQLADGGLRAVGDEPGHLVVEVTGMARAMTCPGHLRDRRPVLRAAHPRRIGLEEALKGPKIETAPPSSPLAPVIVLGATSTEHVDCR